MEVVAAANHGSELCIVFVDAEGDLSIREISLDGLHPDVGAMDLFEFLRDQNLLAGMEISAAMDRQILGCVSRIASTSTSSQQTDRANLPAPLNSPAVAADGALAYADSFGPADAGELCSSDGDDQLDFSDEAY